MIERLEPVSAKLALAIQENSGEVQGSRLGDMRWETDNMDRAVKLCDAYYGGMNVILQPFQGMQGRPILLAAVNGNAEMLENKERIKESRAFF